MLPLLSVIRGKPATVSGSIRASPPSRQGCTAQDLACRNDVSATVRLQTGWRGLVWLTLTAGGASLEAGVGPRPGPITPAGSLNRAVQWTGAPVIFDRTALRLGSSVRSPPQRRAPPSCWSALQRRSRRPTCGRAAELRCGARSGEAFLPNAAEALLATGRVGSVLRAAPLAGALGAGGAGPQTWQGVVAERRPCRFAPESLDLGCRCSRCKA